MNFIQRIRASQLNRHGFIDVLVGIVIFEVVYVYVITSFFSTAIDPSKAPTVSLNFVIFTGLLVAPFVENLLLIGIAALHEKIFKRTGLICHSTFAFNVTPFFQFQGLVVSHLFSCLVLVSIIFCLLKAIRLAQVGDGHLQSLAAL